MGLRLFITGISGYVGRVLAARLDALPEVESITGIGLSARDNGYPPKVRFLQMDIRSPQVPTAMAGHDVVIHAACIVLWSARMPAADRDDINLNGADNVAAAAVRNGVRRFIHTSSMAVYDPRLARGQSNVTEDFPQGGVDPYFYYWSTKAEVERRLTGILDPAGVLTTFLRPIYIMGPGNRVSLEAMRRNATNFPGCNPRRQFIHEDDVASAFVQALRTEMPGPYNVVPDDYLRMRDVWKIVGAKRVPTVPVWAARLVTAMRWRWFRSPIHPSWVEDMLVDFTGSNARLKATGWQPRYGSLETLKSALQVHD